VSEISDHLEKNMIKNPKEVFARIAAVDINY
jgi:hypothetical protein